MRDVYFYCGTGGNMRCRTDGPCSTRMKGSMYPRSARLRLVKLRFPRLRSANPFFRDLLMTLDRRCRYPLPLALRTENAALALRAPSMSHCPALAPPAVKDSFNTILNSSILYRHCMSGTAASGRRAEQEIRTP